MWCVNDYVALIGGILFIIFFGRMSWEEHKAFREREDWRELCRLREIYKPGVNEELKERERLAVLEEKFKT